jgi:hypothetical protein
MICVACKYCKIDTQYVHNITHTIILHSNKVCVCALAEFCSAANKGAVVFDDNSDKE